MEIMEIPQSKLSYHLRVLLDAQLVTLETRGTWSYYELNHAVVNRSLSPDLSLHFPHNGCQAEWIFAHKIRKNCWFLL